MVDQILINGCIYTLDSGRPRASAMAISRNRIVAVGNEEVRDLARAGTRIVDLAGAMVLPAFCDAHIHWMWTALNLKAINLMDIPSREAAVAEVAKAAAKAAPGEWLCGFGWAQGMWAVPDFPTAADLDAVAPNNPVYLSARSGHAVWVNTLALRIGGITDDTPNPPGGEIQRDARGKATGILLEDSNLLVSRHRPMPGLERIADAVEEAQPLAWAAGLGAMHDYDRPDALATFQILRERGTLGIRITKNINDPYIHHAHGLGIRTGFGDPWLRIGGLKIFADGALGSVSAFMLESFDGQPGNKGIVVTPRERIEELVTEATKRGFSSTIHAIGDAAVRDVLDVFEKARAIEQALGIPREARRHRIEHVQIVHPDDANRLGELDIIASMQPIHATSDMEVADRYWGARNRLSYNPRVQIDAGARVAFGSDSPVESFDVLAGIHAAVTRRRANGFPGPDGWYPEARITVDEAIRGYTQGPAWAAHLEHDLGTLKQGWLADLVVLDRDLYEIDPDDILKTRVVGTMIDGKWRHGHWK